MSDTITISVPADLVMTFRDDAVPIGMLPMASVVYLLTNGWSQSFTDVATGARAKVLNDAIADWAKANDRQPNAAERSAIVEAQADAIKAAETDAIAKRMQAIMEGTMVAGSRGGGPRKSALDVYLHGRAEAEAKARLRAKGVKWPTDRAEAQVIVDKVLNHFRAAWTKEYDKAQAKADDLDLGI
jgi:hypothetical protein